ncbi:MAG: ABC transporter substrate-binding protein [Thermoplasmata archaeon]|nr:ABC transporter substrate-binding protein [Thermoplasmata archaeon]
MEPLWLRVSAIVVAALTVGSAYGVYSYYSSAATTGCGLQSKNPLIFDQAERVHTLDPQWAYSTPDWGAVQQVYQALILYNQSSTTQFDGQLAKNWSNSSDGLHFNFTLWPNVHFSNGDPFNAYVMWYSLYRTLAMYGSDQYLMYTNFWLPNDWYNNPNTNYTAREEQNLTWELNNFNFADPSKGPSNETGILEASNQSFRVINPTTIQVNLGNGYIDANYTQPIAYTYVLAELSSVGADAVDPMYIDQHGGVTKAINTWMQNNMVGTGPYLLDLWNPGSSLSFKPDPNYWAAQGPNSPASQQPWNNNLQPAKTSIEISFQQDPSINIQNLRSGAAAGASFAFLGPGTISSLKGNNCLTVKDLSLAYSVANGGWWIYMNQSYTPFNNLTVREAIAHAVNVSYIDNRAFGGWASQWVGPVPPGYPGYNPANLPPYSYNLALAKSLMTQAGYPNGIQSGRGSAGSPIPFLYVGPSPDWDTAMTFVQNNLSAIGIYINPIPLNLATYYTLEGYDSTTGQCIAQEKLNGGPFPMGMEFYSSDWIAPDDWTLNNVYHSGSANICMGGYSNATMDALALQAAGEHNQAKLLADYARMTQTLYSNYTDVWFNVPTLFAVYNNNVAGLVSNPIGSCLPAWNLECNTEYAT